MTPNKRKNTFINSVAIAFASGDDSDTSIENELSVLVKEAETTGMFSAVNVK